MYGWYLQLLINKCYKSVTIFIHIQILISKASSRRCILIDSGYRSHCTLLSVGQSFRPHGRVALICNVTSQCILRRWRSRNRKLAPLLAVAASAAPTFIYQYSQCCNIMVNETILYDNKIYLKIIRLLKKSKVNANYIN